MEKVLKGYQRTKNLQKPTKVQTGTHEIPLLTSVHFDEAHFKRPNEFNPEHFLDADGNFMKNEAFLPFSAGKRNCVGEQLVKVKLFMLFVRLLQTFTFQAPPGIKLNFKAEIGCHNLAFSNILFKNYPLIDDIVNLSGPVTMVLSIILCVFLAIVLYGWKRRAPNFPPGPTPLPLIGNMHILNLKKPYKTFYELSKKYGPVYSIQIGEEKMVILSGYETVKDALVNHANEFSDRPEIPLFHEATKGHGLAFSHNENWKVMRKFAISTVRDFGIGKEIEDRILEECDCLVKKFTLLKGEAFDNRILINAAVANIIVSILLSHRFDYEDATLLRLLEIVNDNVHILGSPTAVFYNAFPSLFRWLPGKHRTLIKNVNEIHTFIREIFTIRRKELDVNDQRNLVDAFLVKQQEEKPSHELFFTNENLTVLVTDLFSAAIDTTSNTLRWGILLMTTYPEIQRKVQYEIEKVIGSSAPHTGHRKNMPYTDAVIHEIQRFGNIVPANLSHYTTQDVNFRGYFLPKGTHVIPLLTSVLFDEAHFKRPNEFNPEHFLDADGNFMKNEAFLPFSAGKRSCIGEPLVKVKLFMLFVRLLQTFTFQAPPGIKLNFKAEIGFIRGPRNHKICAVSRM
ncbi:cytochrome P450 2K1-like [Mantella aurantiaca]